jgi:PAS domain S-box-containing protein
MYPDSTKINEDVKKCFHQKKTITREMNYRFKSIGVSKDLIVRYVYTPPDLILVHAEDVTERKQAEAELHQLFNAVEQTADSVIITNSEGVIEYVNPAFETTTGYSREEAIGKTPNLLKSGLHDAAFYQILWDTLQSGKTYLGQIVNRKKNGELYWSEQTITPMKDYSGKIINFVSVLKDITELRARQEQEFQLKMAREIQQKLLCTGISIPDFDISGKTFSAVETSGDFYDFIRLPDGSYGFIVGDVSGHGVGSALIMAQTRAYLRAFVKIESDPGVLLTRLNKELEADLEAELYVTMIFLRLDPNQMQINYVNAGHVSGYLMEKNGAIRSELESTGIPLGIMKHYQYETSEMIPLRPEDMIILLSDGIMEAHALDNTEFGVDRTLDVIRRNKKKCAADIVKNLYSEVNRFCENQPQEDDITSIICRITTDTIAPKSS